MEPELHVMAEGLGFPEGPVAMPDGSVVFVEIRRGVLTRAWNGKSEVIAHLGGGPNGAAMGPDGAIYVANSGGLGRLPGPRPGGSPSSHDYPTPEPGRIERVDLATKAVEVVYTHCDGRPLRAPNDLAFDSSGGLWFTDMGKFDYERRDYASLCYAPTPGRQPEAVHVGGLSFNGLALSPDERTLYVTDTFSARVWAYDLASPGNVRAQNSGRLSRLVGAIPGDVYIDGMAVTRSGTLCIATIINGGISVLDPSSGESKHVALPDAAVTNLCFGGADLRDAYISMSASGSIVRVRWREPGMRLPFTQY